MCLEQPDDHPKIAKVLDAGATDSGRPYFVMQSNHRRNFYSVSRAHDPAHERGISLSRGPAPFIAWK